MSEAGYTLAEMLVALVVVAGTATALGESLHAMTRIEGDAGGRLVRARDVARAQRALGDFVRDRGPFVSDSQGAALHGSSDRFEFDCAGQTCSADLVQTARGAALELDAGEDGPRSFDLPAAREARFVYADQDGEHGAWPPEDKGRRLRSVTVLADRGPVLVAGLPLEQTADCEFDPVSRVCRARVDGPR